MAIKARNYNRYFDGFSERDVLDEKGKVKTERIYTGSYYREKVDDRLWKRRKISVGFLYIIAVLIYLLCGLVDCDANSCWYVILFYGLSFALMIFVSMNVYTKVTAGRDMIEREFRSAVNQYRKRMRLLSCGMLATAGGVLLNLILNVKNMEWKGIACLFGYAFAGMLLYRLYKVEDQNVYQKIENKVRLKDPDKYVQITY